jgi:hypothetical protein
MRNLSAQAVVATAFDATSPMGMTSDVARGGTQESATRKSRFVQRGSARATCNVSRTIDPGYVADCET